VFPVASSKASSSGVAPSLIRSRLFLSFSTFFLASLSLKTCHGGVGLVPEKSLFGFGFGFGTDFGSDELLVEEAFGFLFLLLAVTFFAMGEDFLLFLLLMLGVPLLEADHSSIVVVAAAADDDDDGDGDVDDGVFAMRARGCFSRREIGRQKNPLDTPIGDTFSSIKAVKVLTASRRRRLLGPNTMLWSIK
jgi:hypothetical protein